MNLFITFSMAQMASTNMMLSVLMWFKKNQVMMRFIPMGSCMCKTSMLLMQTPVQNHGWHTHGLIKN